MTRYRFEDWVFDSQGGCLEKAGSKVHLRHQSAVVLTLLLRNAPELVSRSEIRQALWPDGIVVDFDTGINSCIKDLRQVLGDQAGDARYIRTVPRRGFEFLAVVEEVGGTGTERRRFRIAASVILLIAVGSVVTFLLWPEREPAVLAPRLAILPFDDLSQHPRASSLRTRLLDELIVAVLEAPAPKVDVLSRTRVIDLGQTLSRQTLIEAFNVQFVVDGNLRAIPDGWVVTASFSDARTGRHIWGQIVEIDNRQSDSIIVAVNELAQAIRFEFEPIQSDKTGQ